VAEDGFIFSNALFSCFAFSSFPPSPGGKTPEEEEEEDNAPSAAKIDARKARKTTQEQTFRTLEAERRKPRPRCRIWFL
jgi:hypothetical protein